MPRPQLCKTIPNDVLCVASLYRCAAPKQVRVTSIAPSVDCGEIKIPRGGVGRWKSSRDQAGKCRIEFGKRFAEATCGQLRRDVSRFDTETHVSYRESDISAVK
jgi:hypothetical protein